MDYDAVSAPVKNNTTIKYKNEALQGQIKDDSPIDSLTDLSSPSLTSSSNNQSKEQKKYEQAKKDLEEKRKKQSQMNQRLNSKLS